MSQFVTRKRPRAPTLCWLNRPAPVWGSQDTPPRDTSAWVDPDPDPEATDLPATADLVAMLGFDPDAVEDSVGPEAGEDATPPFAADADWTEADHVRGQTENAGQFAKTAAHAKTVPAPSSYGGIAIKKQAQSIAAAHLTKGTHHQEAAEAIKAFAGQHEHPSVANYANKLLAHVAQAHGVHPNALGTAVAKKPGVVAKPGITSHPKPPPPAPAQPSPTPAAQPVPAASPSGLDPHPDSSVQKAIHAIAMGSASDKDQVEQIKQLVQAHALPADGYAQKFANAWIVALGGDPNTPAKPAVIPANTPVPGSGATHMGAVKGAPARVAKAEKLENAAQQIDTTDSSQALAVAPSLSKAYWSKIPADVKKSITSYGGGGYTPINDALRGDAPTASGFAAAQIENIDSLFDHDEAISTNSVILRRGEETPPDIIDKWKASLKDGWPPCIYTRTGYTSASMAHKPAFSHKPVWFHFVAPKGTRMVGLAGYVGHHENEMLLQHGQTMEIYEIFESGGKTHVKATLK